MRQSLSPGKSPGRCQIHDWNIVLRSSHLVQCPEKAALSLECIIINSHIHGRCHPDFVSTASAQWASLEHLELQIFLSYLLQVPRTEFGSPGRAVHDLNWWASFLAWDQCFRKSTLGAEQESNSVLIVHHAHLKIFFLRYGLLLS